MLTDNQKNTLRQMLAIGWFNGNTPGMQGIALKRPVSADTMKSVGELSDADALAQIVAYQTAAITNINNQLMQITAAQTNANNALIVAQSVLTDANAAIATLGG